jgi:hypothetical protein
LYNCILKNSSSTAVNGGFLYNCTIAGNAQGTYQSYAYNCIIFYNSTDNNQTVAYSSCTTPGGINSFSARGNFTNAPLFVSRAGGDYHLLSNSPCINSGANSYVMTSVDFEGNNRVVGNFVDVGAFEFQSPASALPYLWLQQYSLPVDGSADYADTDGDGMDNWQEWRTGTDPTNTLSVLQMLTPSNSVSGLYARWRSVSGKAYFLQRSTNLNANPPFVTIQSNINGSSSGLSKYKDASATNSGPYFYRVGVQ